MLQFKGVPMKQLFSRNSPAFYATILSMLDSHLVMISEFSLSDKPYEWKEGLAIIPSLLDYYKEMWDKFNEARNTYPDEVMFFNYECVRNPDLIKKTLDSKIKNSLEGIAKDWGKDEQD